MYTHESDYYLSNVVLSTLAVSTFLVGYTLAIGSTACACHSPWPRYVGPHEVSAECHDGGSSSLLLLLMHVTAYACPMRAMCGRLIYFALAPGSRDPIELGHLELGSAHVEGLQPMAAKS